MVDKQDHATQHEDKIELSPKNDSNNKKIILFVVLAIVVLVVAVGGTYYYMNKKQAEQKKQQQAQIDALNARITELQKQPAAQPAQGPQTKQYTTKYEKLKFSYPSTFTLADSSTTQEMIQPGTDKIIISNGNFKMDLQTGLYGIGGSCGDCKVLYAEPITILGKTYSLNFVSYDGGPKADAVIIGTNAQDSFGVALTSKNITPVSDPGGNGTTGISVSASYKNGNNMVAKSVAELQSDPNVTDFKNFVKSFSY